MNKPATVVTVLGIFLVLMFIGIPLYWVLKTSISPEEEVWDIVPKHFTLSNFLDILSYSPPMGKMAEVVGTYAVISPSALTPLKNSLLVASTATVLSLLISSVAAYNLARFSYRGKRAVSFLILIAYIFPPFMLMVPLTIIFSWMGMLNNLFGLALAHMTYTLPFATYMLRGYFMAIPRDLDEAAVVDGCSRFQALRKIILPLALPGLVAVAIFSFVLSWGDVVFSLVLLRTADNYTLPIHIGFYMWGWEITDPGRLAALTVVAGGIPAILFIAIQKWVKMGIVAGAIKG